MLPYLKTRESQPLLLESLYPEGLESTLRRFAIDARNRWMLLQANIVVGYVERSVGGAAKFFSAAEQKGKFCISLAK